MDGSESEAIFEKFNLKPQLFINEALNRVDELIDSAFDYFHQEALGLLKIDGVDRSQDLELGINYIRSTIEASLDKRLRMWEQYCHRYCFAVPSGFSLPSENEAPADDSMDLDEVDDEQVDAQLDTLRSKLAEAGKECSELNRELRELEAKSALTNHFASAVKEALQLYDSSSAQDVFQEMLRVASELRRKMDQLKTKQKEDIVRNRKERADIANGGLCNMKSDSLQEFIAEMNL
ncbi:hypothetical protein RND81_13G104200 [Saponaria officinalis]|uniref:Protein MIS12 homolog n=1 Tax=Saponaria officinalis TaxID=3572 RepID=A0AAW1GZT0_SAPOF